MFKNLVKLLIVMGVCLVASVPAYAASINVIDSGAAGDGKTDNSKIFTNLLTFIGNKAVTLNLQKGIYRFGSNITIPSNVTLNFEEGAVISVDSEKTFTINGAFNANASPIFTGPGNVIGSTVPNGVYPQWWGAIGDGFTNDTGAVQAAMDFAATLQNNKVVAIPEGTYSVRNLYYRQGISIAGNGSSSVLKADSSCVVWNSIIECESIDGVNINGVIFDGNKNVIPGDDQSGVVNMWVTNCTNVQITNCTFQHNWYVGININNCNVLSFVNNRFIDLDCGIITMHTPSNNILIDGNYFDGSDMSEPISIYGTKEGYHNNITITNNIIKNHIYGHGILLRAAKNVVVENNTIDRNGTGIKCAAATYNGIEYGVSDSKIMNNTISNTTYEGILLESISNSTISGNNVKNAGSYGLLTWDVTSCKLMDNTIQDSNTIGQTTGIGGIVFNGLKNSIVSGNKVSMKDGAKAALCRAQISLNGTKNEVANNTFSANTGYPATLKMYEVNTAYALDNIFAENKLTDASNIDLDEARTESSKSGTAMTGTKAAATNNKTPANKQTVTKNDNAGSKKR